MRMTKSGIAHVHHLQHIESLPKADKLVVTAVNAHDKVEPGIGWLYTTCRMQKCLPTADTLNNSRCSIACDYDNQNGTQRTSSCKAYGIGYIHSRRLYCELIICDALTSEA